MKNFYTNCQCIGNRILYRSVEDGQRKMQMIEYRPSIFIPTNKETKYKTLEGQFAERIQPGDIKETKEFINRYLGVDNFTVYGNQSFHYCHISDEFPEIVDYDINQLIVANIDIETAKVNGFGTVENPSEAITAITVKAKDTYYTFGYGDFAYEFCQDLQNKVTKDKVKYIKSSSEDEMLAKFLDFWENLKPDIVTGWNVQFYDLPYLFGRLCLLFGEKEAKRLSPWKLISNRRVNYKGRMHDVIDLVGISTLDYIELYRKFQPKQESEKLNYIAHVELGEKKLDYSAYGDLHNLYESNHQLFIEYNISDVRLVAELDKKLQLINMVVATAYDAKVNFIDVFTQVRMWDAIVFNHLRKQNIVLPPKKENDKEAKYPGGYVKEPKPGMYNWIVSFDLDSLYPHLIAQYNISPECLIPGKLPLVTVDFDNKVDCAQLLRKGFDLSHLKEKNLTIAASGSHFIRDKQGFFPEILMRMYADRVKYKDAQKKAKKELVAAKEELKKDPKNKDIQQRVQQLEFDVAKYNNYQLAKKVQLNSAYGAMGNQYFRFFDIRLAEAVTISGQLVIQTIAQDVNAYLNKLLKTEGQDYIVGIDTDSLYIKFDSLVAKIYEGKTPTPEQIVEFLDKVSETKIKPIIEKSVKDLGEYMNVYAQKMRMKRETIAERALWGAKKRYVLYAWDVEGTRFTEPELKMSGIEAIKSNTPEICRNAFKAAIKLVMTKDQDTLQDFVEKFKEEFFQTPVEELAYPTQCNNLDKYSNSSTIYEKGTPMHVRGALVFNNLLREKNLTKRYEKIDEGDKVRYLLLKEPNAIGTNVISFKDALPKELNIHSLIDMDAQFNKVFLKALDGLLEEIGWSAERKANLDFLFG